MRGSVVIIGAGQAGAETAKALRQGGYPGAITLIGDEPALPYERPPLSKDYLREPRGHDALAFRTGAAYEALGVELLTGTRAERLDLDRSRVELAGGRGLDFDFAVLATGASARRLPVPGADLAGIHTLRTVADAEALHAALGPGVRLVIVGGGYLGLEAASTARALGAEVTLIEAAPTILGRSASPLTAAAMAERHRADGVRLLVGTGVAAFSGTGRVESVVTSPGESIPADVVLVAIGAAPNVALAEAAGIECRNGILAGADCRTSAERVFAIGDCASCLDGALGRHLRLESVQSAAGQARNVTAVILGKPVPPARAPYFWSEQCGAKIQIAGFVDPARPCEDVLVGDPASAFAVYRFQGGALAAVEAIDRPRDFIMARPRIGSFDFVVPAA